MKSVFADTFFWVALTAPGDSDHKSALAFQQQLVSTTLFTTDEVLSEFLTYFADDPWLRKRAAEMVLLLRRTLTVKIIPQSRYSFDAGFELYRARQDKGYSMTDCISMQAMWQEGITEILTNDRHFEQEEFRALFRD